RSVRCLGRSDGASAIQWGRRTTCRVGLIPSRWASHPPPEPGCADPIPPRFSVVAECVMGAPKVGRATRWLGPTLAEGRGGTTEMLAMPKRDWLLLRARLRVVASLTALPSAACDVPDDVFQPETELEPDARVGDDALPTSVE